MKTSFDVIDILFPVMNTGSVTSLIDGNVYRNRKPLNSEAQDIVIVPQPVTGSGEKDVQTGSMLINIFCKDLPNGLPDMSHLKTVTAAVIAVLEAYTTASGTYFAFEIVSEHTASDRDRPMMTCTSLTLNYVIER